MTEKALVFTVKMAFLILKFGSIDISSPGVKCKPNF
jgi:hypothetical protein